MRIVSLSYVKSNGFHDPASWLERVKPYGKVLEALARNHSVISIEQIDYEGKYQSKGVEYNFIRLRNRKIPSSMHSLVKKLGPEVVIVHGLSFPLQVIQLRRTLGKNVTILVQHHADKIPYGWRSWAQKIADRGINRYLFSSADMGSEWIDKKLISGKNKIKEVMVGASTFHPIDKKAAVEATNIKGRPSFLFVGRIDANKDPFTLLRGFSLFAENHPSASLHMILQNPERKEELQKIINEFSKQNNIFLVGSVPHNEMQSWFSSADFIISTSHAEAFGMAVAEGMSCGCVPVVTNIPSFRKITDDGNCGILFEPGNAGQLAAALEKAANLNLDVERKKIRAYYNAHLSAEAIAEQIVTAVNSF